MQAAATDPAYVPGLMPPRAGAQAADEPEQAEAEVPERAGKPGDAAATPSGDVREDASAQDAGDSVADGSVAQEPAAPPEPAESGDGAAEHEPPASGDAGREDDDGPALEVADRRSTIIANRAGIILRLDDQEAEFEWSEIGAVEFQTSKYGRRLTVFVHMPNRHTYQADVTASGRDELKEWSGRLDAVLDAYFEE